MGKWREKNNRKKQKVWPCEGRGKEEGKEKQLIGKNMKYVCACVCVCDCCDTVQPPKKTKLNV